ncbi:hypothetical protein GBAR_LOCUS5891 [Geodia barretti]|uniref:Ubiquitin-like domain-containing protein n=1 Tax=Geodia barretti TaxID=519541 RepID=A0AA35RCV2_GEOBA|nr:hypothetical protein GBAR_LOCUS5891 [Geodia barretti]
MATGGQGEVTLLATYCGKRLSLTVPTSAKVGDVVHKAVETLNLRKEDLPLSLLYQGDPIDDMAPLEVALAKMKGVTAIHLVKRSVQTSGKTTVHKSNVTREAPAKTRKIDPSGNQCSSCKEEGGFERQSAEPVDHFDGEYPKERIIGTCNMCKKTDVLPNISFQCVACEERDQAILRQIRDNIHDIPCMKCSLRQEIVIQCRSSCVNCMFLVHLPQHV